MRYKLHILLFLLIIFLVLGCSKDNTTSNSKSPYFNGPVQISAVAVTGHEVIAGIAVTDPNEKQVQAKFDWGDGTVTDYSDLFDSGTSIQATHTYSQTGFYEVKAYARNESNVETGAWSEEVTIQILNTGEPYAVDIYQSKTEMTVGNSVEVRAMLEELSGFQVQGRVDWGDGMISAWTALTIPSTLHTFNYTYNQTGEFQIKLQVRSNLDSLSVWYDTPNVLKVYDAPPENELVMVTGGTFVMGSVSPVALSNEAPLDTVDVADFYMSRFEISQAEWMDIMTTNPSYFSGVNGDIHAPVENVDWYDCLEYCNKRSMDEGLTPCYSIVDTSGTGETNPALWPAGWHPVYPDTSMYQNQIVCDYEANGYRLPTEAEWEYAAKEGTNSTYSGTEDIDELRDYAWFNGEGYHTHIVGLKQPNNFGLYDMTGNVWEWCWNAYRFYPGNTTYLSDENRSLRITRGGSFSSSNSTLRTAYRNMIKPSLKSLVYGLRVVRKA